MILVDLDLSKKIDVESLRIGSLVKVSGHDRLLYEKQDRFMICEIDATRDNVSVSVKKKDDSRDIIASLNRGVVEPIEITEDILEEYGFTKNYYGDYEIESELGLARILLMPFDGYYSPQYIQVEDLRYAEEEMVELKMIKYLHELQDLMKFTGMEKQ